MHLTSLLPLILFLFGMSWLGLRLIRISKTETLPNWVKTSYASMYKSAQDAGQDPEDPVRFSLFWQGVIRVSVTVLITYGNIVLWFSPNN